ncbi:MAG: hypothetical protein P1U34_12495 [Coxiellaceae bacterium]|nr:hypothetical protein [Coxiellaceae bacterium]
MMNTNKQDWRAPEFYFLRTKSTLSGGEMPLGETTDDHTHLPS